MAKQPVRRNEDRGKTKPPSKRPSEVPGKPHTGKTKPPKPKTKS